MASDDTDEFRITFQPPLYLQRQTWVLDILRREAVQSVLDIGCGEGSLLQCLIEPSLTRPPATSLPATSPLVSGPSAEYHADLHLRTIHGLDPYLPDLKLAILGTAPPDPEKPPFTGYDRWARRDVRWTPLEVSLWEGGFEAINEAFEGDKFDAFVASEVIEHLPPELLPLFAPVLLGHYQPRLLLLTTPNYTYNERFTRPGEISPTGYPDPTGRTNRVFRHHDHKFEWTPEEWTKYCTDAASEFGYSVEVGGIGFAVEPDPWDREAHLGFASQVATFRRLDANQPKAGSIPPTSSNSSAPAQRPVLRARYLHLPHPLSLEELARSPVTEEIRQAVKAAMNDNREGTMAFSELWKHGEVSLKCAGDIGGLVRAFEPVSLDQEEWVVEDEVKGWETKVSWKKFVTIEDPPEQPEFEALQDISDGPEDDPASEEDVVDDVLSTDPAPPQVESKKEEEFHAWGQEGCAWGGASEGVDDPWGWDVTGTEACSATSAAWSDG